MPAMSGATPTVAAVSSPGRHIPAAAARAGGDEEAGVAEELDTLRDMVRFAVACGVHCSHEHAMGGFIRAGSCCANALARSADWCRR